MGVNGVNAGGGPFDVNGIFQGGGGLFEVKGIHLFAFGRGVCRSGTYPMWSYWEYQPGGFLPRFQWDRNIVVYGFGTSVYVSSLG